jgi:hypothetical protein
MPLITPRYTKHSEVLGVTIYKRKASTGSHGGNWMADSVTYKTLALCKSAIEFYANPVMSPKEKFHMEQIEKLRSCNQPAN